MDIVMVDRYRPGVCNIGPTEIAARRRLGHAFTLVTVGLFAAMLAGGVPDPFRLLLFIPAAVAAAGYLQAATRFCADYGWRGVFNLGDRLRDTTRVPDPAARAADRRKALLIGAGSGAAGLAVALVALLV